MLAAVWPALASLSLGKTAAWHRFCLKSYSSKRDLMTLGQPHAERSSGVCGDLTVMQLPIQRVQLAPIDNNSNQADTLVFANVSCPESLWQYAGEYMACRQNFQKQNF